LTAFGCGEQYGSMDPKSLTDGLRKEIEAGLLAPGAPLRQEEIARRFGVSRQPVRQALHRLAAEGVLARRSDRTLVVIGLDERDAAEIANIRVVLESEALRQAFEHLDSRSIRTARRIAADLADEDDPAQMEELDVAFHQALYRGCGNDRLKRLIDTLRRESRRAYHTQPKPSANRQRYVEDHEELLRACEQRDLSRALAALAQHLTPVTARAETQLPGP
jgi:DNA-binding GntR family transcriptional regulator